MVICKAQISSRLYATTFSTFGPTGQSGNGHYPISSTVADQIRIRQQTTRTVCLFNGDKMEGHVEDMP